METIQVEKTIKLVPKLRFNGFDEDWEEKKLGDIVQISSSARVHKEEWTEKGVPFFRSSDVVAAFNGKQNMKAYIPFDLYNSLSKKIGRVKIDDILITGGGSIGIPFLIKNNEPLYFKDADLLWIKNNEKICGYFLYSYFLTPLFKNHLKSVSHIGTIAHYTVTQAKNTPFNLPSLTEQQKIASFLSAVDEKIQQLTRKKKLLEQYKKGVTQQLFSGKLRFKDENGKDYADWEEKKLGECLDYIQPTKYLVSSTEYDNSYNTPVLTAGKTFILGYTNETTGIFKNNLPVIIFDDFTTATKFVDFPFKAKSSAMKILVPFKEVNIKFFYEAMQIMKYEIGGHERHWISKFSQILMPFPCFEEQQKIANFLSSIDDKIESASQQINQMQSFKKGLLQQLFV